MLACFHATLAFFFFNSNTEFREWRETSFLLSPVFSPDQGFLENDLPFGQARLLQPHTQAEVQAVWSVLLNKMLLEVNTNVMIFASEKNFQGMET